MSSHIPPTPKPPRRRWTLLLALLMLLWLGLLSSACSSRDEAETVSFERAEVAYRQGHYKVAVKGYHEFLKRHPKSPLARMAKLRIRCIQREVRAMLDRHDMPRPIYIGSKSDATPNSDGSKKLTDLTSP